MLKIFYSGLRYNNYSPRNGTTFEHENFYKSLEDFPGAEVHYFPFDRILEIGRKKFNQEILDGAKQEKPDLIFFFMLSDELDKKILDELKRIAPTAAWFADDSWRFWNYSRFWAKYFTWAITTYSYMPALYKKYGQPNVIRSQWAANTELYKPHQSSVISHRPPVSFVGGWSKPRQKIISLLRKAGIKVECYGSGWPNGRVSEEKMLDVFSGSKINLALNPAPGYFNKNSLGRLFFRRSINKIVPDLRLAGNFRSWLSRGTPQIKARHFEIPAGGGFMLTETADDLDKFYEPGQEIVFYKGTKDLADKIRYFLTHSAEREKIARAGRERTFGEHTYRRRFSDIFKKIGLINQ